MENKMSEYSSYIHLSRYARFIDEKGRRETWEETVDRYVNYWKTKTIDKFNPGNSDYNYIKFWNAIKSSILNLEVMPSMRALMTAGEALDRDNISGFNCSYLAIDNVRAFDEVMYILMCGTGVGFSVERQYIQQLPTIAEEFHESDSTIVIKDSRIGWASGFRELLSLLYSGKIPKWDTTRLRPAGARLKVFGGRSSGPEPLEELFKFAVQLFNKAAGRKLNSLECHDLVCKIADIVVVGGVRRSALISLSNLTDERLRHAKDNLYYQDETGVWKCSEPQRALANNSVAYTEKPDIGIFLKEWTSLYESKSGERGIFNRVAATKQSKASGRRDTEGWDYGTNPCGEIILRSMGLCNLSEVVIRPDDTFDDLKRKVEIAAIIGTLQSTLTDFRYVRSAWKKNAEEERLLGVSLTGIMDNPVMSEVDFPGELGIILEGLKQHAIETNKIWAERLGIPPSVAITTIKPSGTVSQLVDSSSGIHPRQFSYFIRTVRGDKKDPLAKFLKEQGVPCEDDVMRPDSVEVFSFPRKSPEGAITARQLTALDQLELYAIYRKYWCEHNPSITVYVREHEWFDVGAWVYKNFDELGGVSFLPLTEHSYKQAPYQEITKEEYEERVEQFPTINWGEFKETSDTTSVQPELACSSGMCEVL